MTEYVKLNLYDNDSVEVPIVCRSLFAPLAIHRTFQCRLPKAYTVTHIPTGLSIRQTIDGRRKAEDLMLALERTIDWRFRVPHSPKWEAQKANAKQIVFEVIHGMR